MIWEVPLQHEHHHRLSSATACADIDAVVFVNVLEMSMNFSWRNILR
jgi:hypothetical protein